MSLSARFPQGLHEQLSILLVVDDGLPAIASIHHMVDRPFVFNPQFPRHAQRFRPKAEQASQQCGLLGLTPFRLVTWKRPYRQTSVFDAAAWAALPKEMTVRLVEIVVEVGGFRTQRLTLATTLLDPEKHSPEDLGRLYFRRWAVEVFYRDIKQTMAMDILRCKSPEMIDKEVIMHAIAHNLIRALIQDIAQSYEVEIHRLSFKGTLDALRQWQPLLETGGRERRPSVKWVCLLYEIVVTDPLILRPNRSEPRAVKRRPKNYRLLTKPRKEMVVERCRKLSQKSSKKALN